MTTATACESCGMPIETGRYCGYCTDETGNLQSFDERFERMTAWQARRDPGASRLLDLHLLLSASRIFERSVHHQDHRDPGHCEIREKQRQEHNEAGRR